MKIFIIGSVTTQDLEQQEFEAFFYGLGKALSDQRLTIILCSPYSGSCDNAVVNGLKAATSPISSLELHYPSGGENELAWDQALNGLQDKIKVERFRHESPGSKGDESRTYSWLFCQLQAITTANRILITGGKLDGSANLLTRIAEAQQKELIPLAAYGGVGERYYDRKRYELQDKWGIDGAELLSQSKDPQAIANAILAEMPQPTAGKLATKLPPVFFISYAREYPAEADFIEMILRRRNYTILRDDDAIAAGAEITPALREMVYRATIFIAVYSKAYACSPWCFDELQLGLENHLNRNKALWIFRTEEVRMVHPDARNINFFNTFNRNELEGQVLKLLDKL